MPTVITKVKPKAPVAKTIAKPVSESTNLDPSEMSIEQVADQYAKLKDQVEALMLNPIITQLQVITEELKSRLLEFKPDELVTIKGQKALLEIGACSKKPREVADVLAVAEMLGQATFSQLAKIKVGDAEKYLTPEQLNKVVWPNEQTPVEETYTTNRKIVVKHL